jgi:cell division protein FtsL
LSAYMHGNLAVEERQRTGQKSKIKETRKVVYRQRTIPMGEKLLYLGGIGIISVMSGFIIWQHALIYKVNTDIMKTQQTIQAAEMESSILKKKIAGLKNQDALRKSTAASGLIPTQDDKTVRAPLKTKDGKPSDGSLALKR